MNLVTTENEIELEKVLMKSMIKTLLNKDLINSDIYYNVLNDIEQEYNFKIKY